MMNTVRRIAAFAVALTLALAVAPAVPATAPSQRAHVTASVQSLGIPVGRLQIPAIGLDETVREGIDMAVINQGVAHWAGTAMPGRPGNIVLAGHRTTRTRPFYYLNRLEPGDEVVATGLDGQRATYRVTETLIVGPSDVWIANWTATPTLTMFACHPRGSARQRIVVRAELVGAPVALP